VALAATPNPTGQPSLPESQKSVEDPRDFYKSDKFRNMKPRQRLNHFDSNFSNMGTKYDIEPRVLRSLARAESDGDPWAKSPANARGLMQITPITERQISKLAKQRGVDFGGKFDPYNPQHAVEGGAIYWNWLKKRVSNATQGQDLDLKKRRDLALMAYNWGPGNLKPYLAGKKEKPAESDIHSKRFWASYNRNQQASAAPQKAPGSGPFS